MDKPAFSTMTTTELCQWYKEVVGYDPLSAEGGWEEDEVLGLCEGIYAEIEAAERECE